MPKQGECCRKYIRKTKHREVVLAINNFYFYSMNLIFDKNIVSNFYSEIESDKFHRYKSWEHCYKEFSVNNDIDKLSLHLAFYLASWGMYRGSSGLLQKDYKVHHGAVEIIISSKYQSIRAFESEIKREHIPLILELFNELSKYYGDIEYVRNREKSNITSTDTLITKIMLGTLGCLPAYDRFFNRGLVEAGITQKVGKRSLNQLFDFIDIDNNAGLIAKAATDTVSNNLKYPTMKIIDMFFWSVGYAISSSSNMPS